MAEVIYRPLASLRINPKNPRKADSKKIKALAESIKANPLFFEARPILLSDRTGELVIIGGEQRSKAAALLGLEEVPTILLSGLSEEREDEIMILDNTHAGIWDESKLQTWGKEQLQSWNVEGVNWENVQSDEIPKNLDAVGREKDFILKITFPDAKRMTNFVTKYKNILEQDYECTMSESGGSL